MIIIVIFVPWTYTRIYANESVEKIYLQHIVTHSEAISSNTEEFLSQYDVPAKLLLKIDADPDIIKCEPTDVKHLVRFAVTTRNILETKPSTFLYGENMTTLCAIQWPNDTDTSFNFYFAMENPTTNQFYLKRYDDKTDFENFDANANTGQIVAPNYTGGMNVLYPISPPPIEWKPLFKSADSTSYSIIGLRYINTFDNSTYKMSGVGFEVEKLYSALNALIGSTECKFILMNSKEEVIIDGDIGKLNPQGFEDNLIPILPKIKDLNNSFWSLIEEHISDLENGNIYSFEFDREKYIAKMRYITGDNKMQFKIILAYKLNTAITELYSITTLILVISIVIIGVALFATLKIIRHTELDAKEKLRRVPPLADDRQFVDPNWGTLSHSVHRLRSLQLAFAEEQMMSKIIDNAVSSLTHVREVVVGADGPDTLSDILRSPQVDIPTNEAPLPFSQWPSTTGRAFNASLSSLEFDWTSAASDPLERLLIEFGSAVRSLRLLSSDVDPDGLMGFVEEFGSECTSPALLALKIHVAGFLLAGDFREWIPQRFDELLVLLAVLVTPQNSTADRGEAADHANDILRKHIGHDEGGYLDRMLRALIVGTADSRLFELIGELSLVSEAPDFSIYTNMHHRFLFMRALVKLCAFGTYICPTAILREAIAEETKVSPAAALPPEKQAMYHFEVAGRALGPLISTFANFCPIEDLTDVYKANLINLELSANNRL